MLCFTSTAETHEASVGRRTCAAGDVGVDEEPPDGRGLGLLLAVLLLLVFHRTHYQNQQEPVD